MKNSLTALVLSFASTAFAGQTILTATDGAVSYTPALADGWAVFAAPGSYNGQKGSFLVTDQDKGKITINPTEAFTGLEFWGWQRSDGGAYEITFDGGKAVRVDVYNKKSDGEAHPMRLFTIDKLSNAKHVVQLTNLNDTRVGKFGQMNIDHVVLTTVDSPSPTGNVASTSSSSTTAISVTEVITTASSTSSESSATDSVSTPASSESTTGTPVVIQSPASTPSSSASTPSSPQQNTPPAGAASTLGASVSAVLAAILLFAL